MYEYIIDEDEEEEDERRLRIVKKLGVDGALLDLVTCVI